jgi:hypothetical protein
MNNMSSWGEFVWRAGTNLRAQATAWFGGNAAHDCCAIHCTAGCAAIWNLNYAHTDSVQGAAAPDLMLILAGLPHG